jgi:hypothetical protein
MSYRVRQDSYTVIPFDYDKCLRSDVRWPENAIIECVLARPL